MQRNFTFTLPNSREMKNAYKILIRKPERKIPIWRPR
jgi:hypothetical protein